jgi:hypothetical protein
MTQLELALLPLPVGMASGNLSLQGKNQFAPRSSTSAKQFQVPDKTTADLKAHHTRIRQGLHFPTIIPVPAQLLRAL